ncbi:hypothetical protein C8R46DRAFT_1048829 [Mycena filopes]|nr:hypothetical protein C8R46DRAFT_1048829 [Mycena filopes]
MAAESLGFDIDIIRSAETTEGTAKPTKPNGFESPQELEYSHPPDATFIFHNDKLRTKPCVSIRDSENKLQASPGRKVKIRDTRATLDIEVPSEDGGSEKGGSGMVMELSPLPFRLLHDFDACEEAGGTKRSSLQLTTDAMGYNITRETVLAAVITPVLVANTVVGERHFKATIEENRLEAHWGLLLLGFMVCFEIGALAKDLAC